LDSLPEPERTRPDIRPVPASPGTGEEIGYSRTIRGTTGQLLEVPFRGTGWVYLGETDARRGVSYVTRRTDPEGQTFVFRLDESGEYTLLFYKQDFIRDYILNDQVRVIVEDETEKASPYAGEPARLIAEPRWPPLESPGGRTDLGVTPPEAAEAGQNGTSPETAVAAEQGNVSAETAVAIGQSATLPEAVVTDGQGGTSAETAAVAGQSGALAGATDESLLAALMDRAREAYGAGHFPEALAALDEMQSSFPLGSDEAWWLYGQLLEASGPKRDIRGALEYYRRLIREYPQSPRCDDARKRIAYLERFYFNIR
jgi:tetratricopeptide (TPR) repeat protein